ncbi:MAG: hypothetical protein ACK58T_32020, partial [Phycisphaerae bacterium]
GGPMRAATALLLVACASGEDKPVARGPSSDSAPPATFRVVLVADTFPERRFTLAGVNSPSYFWMMSDTPNGPFVAVAVATEVKSRYKHILTGKPERLEGEIRIFRLPDPAAE